MTTVIKKDGRKTPFYIEKIMSNLENAETRKTIINQLEKVGATVIKKNGTFVTHDPSMNKIILAI